MIRMALIAGLAALAVACGGDDGGSVLQFTGRDETEANFRDRVTSLKETEPGNWVQFCAAIQDMTPQQAAAVLIAGDDDDGEPIEGATPKPGQVAQADDLVRAAEIVMEECER